MTDRLDEIEARVRAVPGDWTIEERPQIRPEDPIRYALYSGRGDQFHGLNLVGLVEPDFRWKEVRAFLEASHSDVLWLVEELRQARADRDEAWERLTPKCVSCGESVRDYYMVRQQLWEAGTDPHEREGQMHWDCLAERLRAVGTILTKEDLTSAPVNDWFRKERGW